MDTDTNLHDLAGAYAVDALPEDERRFFERHVEECEACAREVAELQDTAALLAGAVAEEPPAGLRERVLAAAARTDQEGRPAAEDTVEPPAAPHQSTVPDRAVRWRVLAPAVAAALVLLGGLTAVGAELFGGGAPSVEQQVASVLEAPDGRSIELAAPGGGTARFVWSAERGEGVFATEGMAQAPAGHGYALWVIEGETPAFAGLLRPDADGRAVHGLGEEVRGADAVAVTLEPDGASLDAPTTDPLMVGQL